MSTTRAQLVLRRYGTGVARNVSVETWDLEALKKESLRAVDLQSFRRPTRLQVIEKVPAVNALLGESEEYRRVRTYVEQGNAKGIETTIAERASVGKEVGIFWYTCLLQAVDNQLQRRVPSYTSADLQRIITEVDSRHPRRGPEYCVWLARVYVRMGDLPSAFEAVRSMKTSGFVINSRTLNSFLAAATTRESSMAVFNHMVMTYQLEPNLQTYEHFSSLCASEEEEFELHYFMSTAWNVVLPPFTRRIRPQGKRRSRGRDQNSRPDNPRREDAAGLAA